MTTTMLKKDEKTGEYYFDLQDFKDILDIDKVDTYETVINKDTNEVTITFFDKDGKRLLPKSKK